MTNDLIGGLSLWNKLTNREDIRIVQWRFAKWERKVDTLYFVVVTLQCKDRHYRSKLLGIAWRKPRLRIEHLAILA